MYDHEESVTIQYATSTKENIVHVKIGAMATHSNKR
jgi:hypothetical protein